MPMPISGFTLASKRPHVVDYAISAAESPMPSIDAPMASLPHLTFEDAATGSFRRTRHEAIDIAHILATLNFEPLCKYRWPGQPAFIAYRDFR